LIDRAIREGTDLILEGAHLVPGFLEGAFSDEALIVPLLITVEDEELHRSHFYWRTRDAQRRPSDRYLNNFNKIRRLQQYMISSALARGVPAISHTDLDASLSAIIDHVIERAMEKVELGTRVVGEGVPEGAVETIGQFRGEGSTTSETIS
jgi:2-phosphoglycerate kinase